MSKNSKSQIEANKKGKERIKKFEGRIKVEEETPIIKSIGNNTVSDDIEEYTVTAYQKIEPGEWEKVELTYRRIKRR